MSSYTKRDYKGEFESLVTDSGYKLLNEYVNMTTKVELQCDRGHIYDVRPYCFKQGSRCSICSGNNKNQSIKEFVELINNINYKLIGTYEGNNKKVKMLCIKGHEYEATPYSLKSGKRCSICSNNSKTHSENMFMLSLMDNGYKLIGKYINSGIPIEVMCQNGHLWSVRPNDFKSKQIRCPFCKGTTSIQSEERFICKVKSENYILLEGYKTALTKVKLKCPNGHIWDTKPSSFMYGYRCPHCEGSTGQRLLQNILSSLPYSVIYNDRSILGGLELDIYFPDIKLAIEYQGNYWHSKTDAIIRDEKKRNLCKTKGIYLIEVWDDKFISDPVRIGEDIYNTIIEYVGTTI